MAKLKASANRVLSDIYALASVSIAPMHTILPAYDFTTSGYFSQEAYPCPAALCDTSELEQKNVTLGQELAMLVEMTQNCIAENARITQDQGEYQKCYNGLVEWYERAKSRLDEVTDTLTQRLAKGERLAGFIRTLAAQDEPVAEIDERLWGAMVDYVTVGVDGGMTVVFWDGTEIQG